MVKFCRGLAPWYNTRMAINIKALGITPELPISEWERTAALPPAESDGEAIRDTSLTLAEISAEMDHDPGRQRQKAREWKLKSVSKDYRRWLDIL